MSRRLAILSLGVALLIGLTSRADDADEKKGIYDGKSLRVWIGLLKDRDPATRIRAAQTLWKIGPKARTAVPALGEALRDRNADVRRFAALALGAIGAEARLATRALRESLRDAEPVVRASAARSL